MRTLIVLTLVMAIAPACLLAAEPKPLVVDHFDGDGPKIGRGWETYADDNNLGTKVNPFAVEKEASPKDFKGHGHFSGHLGKNKDPWPWINLDLSLQDDGPKDLSEYKALRFWVKGDGKKHRARLGRAAIEDYCYPEAQFTAEKEWTLVTIPLGDFKQPNWGKQVPAGRKDVTIVGFAALANGDDEDFDFRFTGLEFVAEMAEKK